MSRGRWLALAVLLASPAALAETGPLRITGTPASPEFLAEMASRHGFLPPSGPVAPGESRPAGAFTLENVHWPGMDVSHLSFSDHPEEVEGQGQLFSGGLVRFKPVRFQYYHLGGSPEPLELSLRVFNPGPEAAELHVISAHGGPSANYFEAGHRNNVQLLARLARNEGEILSLPPGAWTQLAVHTLPRGQVVSGTVQMTEVDGPPLDYGLFALTPGAPIGMSLLADEKDVHARGFYPVADQLAVRSYTVGRDQELRLAFGALRQDNIWGARELRGDYGVLYRMRLHLHNPGSRTEQVQLLFNPRGGVATGTFWLDGELLEVGQTQAFATPLLKTWALAPGEKRALELWTFPEGASNYPVRLIVRGEANSAATAPPREGKTVMFGKIKKSGWNPDRWWSL